jgi:hypothetical protein
MAKNKNNNQDQAQAPIITLAPSFDEDFQGMRVSTNSTKLWREIREAINNNFAELQKPGNVMIEFDFGSDGTSESIWTTWLDSFPVGVKNTVWRQKGIHDCQTCQSFFKRVGKYGAITEDLRVLTVFDGLDSPDFGEYSGPAAAVLDRCRKAPIKMAVITDRQLKKIHASYEGQRILLVGTPSGREDLASYTKDTAQFQTDAEGKPCKRRDGSLIRYLGGSQIVPGKTYLFEHLYGLLNPEKIVKEPEGSKPGWRDQEINSKRTDFKALLKNMTFYSDSTLDATIGFFDKKCLRKAETYRWMVEKLKLIRKKYFSLPEEQRDLYLWYVIGSEGLDSMVHIDKNAIGVFLDAAESAYKIAEKWTPGMTLSSFKSFVDGELYAKAEKFVNKHRNDEDFDGFDLDTALQDAANTYNTAVDPENYGKVTSIKADNVDKAKDFLMANGYMPALWRRPAEPEDLNPILTRYKRGADTTSESVRTGGQDEAVKLFTSASTNMKDPKAGVIPESRFSSVPVMGYEEFLRSGIQNAKEVKILLSSRFQSYLGVLHTAKVDDAKPLYPWGSLGWTCANGLTGRSTSEVKAAVKSAGAFSDAYFSTSVAWNWQPLKPGSSIGVDDKVDLDIMLVCTNRRDWVYYGSKNRIDETVKDYKTQPKTPGNVLSWYEKTPKRFGAVQDCDVTARTCRLSSGISVENIFILDKKNVPDGEYIALVNNFGGSTGGPWQSRTLKGGFKAQVTVGNVTREYHFTKELKRGRSMPLAYLKFKDGLPVQWLSYTPQNEKWIRTQLYTEFPDSMRDWDMLQEGGLFPEITEVIAEDNRDMMGLPAGQFYRVNMISYSPNYLESDKDHKVGEKYICMFIPGMALQEALPAINVEHLNPELKPYRRGIQGVINNDALEDKKLWIHPDPSVRWLAGVFFDPSLKDSVIADVTYEDGTSKKYKVTFGNI